MENQSTIMTIFNHQITQCSCTCCTMMVSASSCVVRRSCRWITSPVVVCAAGPGNSDGTGSGPVTIRLYVAGSSLWATRSWMMRSITWTLFVVTEKSSDRAGRRDVSLSRKTRLAPFSCFRGGGGGGRVSPPRGPPWATS